MKKCIAYNAALIAVLLAGVSGCSDSTRPEEKLGVVLTLSAETRVSEDQEFVVAVVEVENFESQKINYPAGCGFLVGITVEDVEGIRLTIWDPELNAICPPVHHSLAAGASIGEAWDLRWAWDEVGVKYRIPAGRYTAHTEFTYYLGGVNDPMHIEKTLEIELD